jgi:hypothetical protein
MAANLETAEIGDNLLWDAFVAESPQGSVFSSSAWMRAAAAAQGGRPVLLGVLENGKPVAGTAFVEVVRGPLRKATSPVLTPYGGMMYGPYTGKRPSEAESFHHACAEVLIDHLRKRYSSIFLVHDPNFTDVRPFVWKGFCTSVRYTYIMDLSDLDHLWDLVERRVRTVIRNGESVLALDGPLGIKEFGELYERTYRDRGNTPPIARSIVERMIEPLLAEGIAEMRTVRDVEGSPIAAMVFAFDRRTVYALVSGTIPARNPSGASSLLFWDAAKRHAGTRAQLDLVGANIPSIAFFKKGFGGALAPYYCTERYSSPAVRAAFSLYHRMHKVLS